MTTQEHASVSEREELDAIIRETAVGPLFYGESFTLLCAKAILAANFRKLPVSAEARGSAGKIVGIVRRHELKNVYHFDTVTPECVQEVAEALTTFAAQREARIAALEQSRDAFERDKYAIAAQLVDAKAQAARIAELTLALETIANGNVPPGFLNNIENESKAGFQERFACWMQEHARSAIRALKTSSADDKRD